VCSRPDDVVLRDGLAGWRAEVRSRYRSVETDAGCDDVEADRGEAEGAWS
jgi:hypothetical protein